jgi:hypothetical protein
VATVGAIEQRGLTEAVEQAPSAAALAVPQSETAATGLVKVQTWWHSARAGHQYPPYHIGNTWFPEEYLRIGLRVQAQMNWTEWVMPHSSPLEIRRVPNQPGAFQLWGAPVFQWAGLHEVEVIVRVWLPEGGLFPVDGGSAKAV